MKRLTVIGLALAGALCAQEKTTIPFSNPSAPRKLVVDLLLGSVTVKGYSGQEAIIESTEGRGYLRRGPEPPPPPGMHRIGGGRAESEFDPAVGLCMRAILKRQWRSRFDIGRRCRSSEG